MTNIITAEKVRKMKSYMDQWIRQGKLSIFQIGRGIDQSRYYMTAGKYLKGQPYRVYKFSSQKDYDDASIIYWFENLGLLPVFKFGKDPFFTYGVQFLKKIGYTDEQIDDFDADYRLNHNRGSMDLRLYGARGILIMLLAKASKSYYDQFCKIMEEQKKRILAQKAKEKASAKVVKSKSAKKSTAKKHPAKK